MKLRSLALCGALIATSALAGCSSSDSTATTAATTTAAETTTVAETTTEEATEAPEETTEEATEAPEETTEEAAETTEFDVSATKYHAFLSFQTATYSFRNEIDEASYGYYGTSNTDEIGYNVVHAWAGNDLVAAAGDFQDTGFDGDGTYTVSVTGLDWKANEEALGREEFTADAQAYNIIQLSTDIPWAAYGEGCTITFDELKIGDTVIALDQDAIDSVVAESYDGVDPDDEATTNINISLVNKWADAIKTLPGSYDGYADTISITFTVAGLDDYEGDAAFTYLTDDADDTDDADAEDTAFDVSATKYHGFLGFQTATYSFRNEISEASYGYFGTSNTDEIGYNVVHAWAGNDLVSAAGDFHDVGFDGDGTYTVSVTGLDWKANEEALGREEFTADAQAYNIIQLSTDIPWAAYGEGCTITFDELKIGDTVIALDQDAVDSVVAEAYDGVDPDDEATTCMSISLVNKWADAIKTLPGSYDGYADTISITFTVTGLDSYEGDAAFDYTAE